MCVLSLLSQNTLGEQFPKVELAFENDDFITRAKTQTRRFWARELGGLFEWAGAGQLSRAFEAIPSQICVFRLPNGSQDLPVPEGPGDKSRLPDGPQGAPKMVVLGHLIWPVIVHFAT